MERHGSARLADAIRSSSSLATFPALCTTSNYEYHDLHVMHYYQRTSRIILRLELFVSIRIFWRKAFDCGTQSMESVRGFWD